MTLPEFQLFFDRMLQFVSKKGAGEKELPNFQNESPQEGLYVACLWYHNVQFFGKPSAEGVLVAGHHFTAHYSERTGFDPHALASDSRGGLYISFPTDHEVRYIT